MAFPENFLGPLHEFYFIVNSSKPKLEALLPKHTAPRRIASEKRDGIMKILRTNKREEAKQLFVNIPINDTSKDLCTDCTFSIAE